MAITGAGAAGAAQAAGQLIGGGGGGGGNTFISPDQLPYLQDLFQRAQDFSNQGTFIGLNPLQQQAQQNALTTAANLSPFINQSQQGLGFLTSGAVLDPSTNPYLAQTAQAAVRPIFENLSQNILPSIRGNAAQAGQVGSSRQGIAEGLAAQGALRSAGDISSNIYSQGYGQGLGALTQGLGLAPSIAQLGFLPSQVQAQIGAENRALSQEQILDPFTQLQRYQSLLGGPIVLNKQDPTGGTGLTGLFSPGGFFENIGVTGGSGGGLLGGLGGGVAGNLAGLGSLF